MSKFLSKKTFLIIAVISMCIALYQAVVAHYLFGFFSLIYTIVFFVAAFRTGKQQ